MANNVIATASGGRALKGMAFIDHPTVHTAAKQTLLRFPSNMMLMNPAQSSKFISYCFSSSRQSYSFTSDVKEKGWTLACQIHTESFLWSASAPFAQSSHELQRDERRLQSKVSQACILDCMYVPTASFQITREKMMLSDAALAQALSIRSAIDADKFLQAFNPFVSQGVYHLGGVFLRRVAVKLTEEATLSELMTQTQKAISVGAKGNASPAGGIVSVDACAEGSLSGNNDKKVSEATSFNIQVREENVEVLGPTTARNAEEFQKMLKAGDPSCWSIIDQDVDNEGSLVPVWELLLQYPTSISAENATTRDDVLRAAKILCDRWIYLRQIKDDLHGATSASTDGRGRHQRSLLSQLVDNARLFSTQHASQPSPSSSSSSSALSPVAPSNITVTSLLRSLKQRVDGKDLASLIRDYIKTHRTSSATAAEISEDSKALQVLRNVGFDMDTGCYTWNNEVDATIIVQKLESVLHPSVVPSIATERIIEWRDAINDITMLWPQYAAASTFRYVGSLVADTKNGSGQESMSTTISSLARRYIDCLRHRLDPHEHMHLFLSGSTSIDDDHEEAQSPRMPGEEEEEDEFVFEETNKLPPLPSERKSLFEILIYIFQHSELLVQIELCRLLLAQRASTLLIFPRASSPAVAGGPSEEQKQLHVILDHSIEAFRFTRVGLPDEKELNVHEDLELSRVVFVTEKETLSRSHSAIIASRVMHCDFVSQHDLHDGMCHLPGILPTMEVGVGFIKSEPANARSAALTPWLCFQITGRYLHPVIMQFIRIIADIVVVERAEGQKQWFTPKAFWKNGGVPNGTHVRVLQWRETDGDAGFNYKKGVIWGQESYIVTHMGKLLDSDRYNHHHHENTKRMSLMQACTQHLAAESSSHMHRRFINPTPIDEVLMNNPSCPLSEVRQKLVLQKSLVTEGRAFLEYLGHKDDLGKKQEMEQVRREERERRRKCANEVADLPIVRLFHQILCQEDAVSRTVGILTLQASIAKGMQPIYADLNNAIDKNYCELTRLELGGNEDAAKSRDAFLRSRQEYVERSIGIHNLWREVSHMYETDPQNQRPLATLAAQHLLDGFPLEVLDGDASMYCNLWVEAVLAEVQKTIVSRSSRDGRGAAPPPRIFVLSAMGVQSSGKSTLLNLMFGTRLPTSAGRCTKGVFMQLVPSNRAEYEYVLLLDTEGLRSNEFHGLDGAAVRDNRLATFGLLPADACVLMVSNEDDGPLKDVLPMVMLAFKDSSLAERCGGRIKAKLSFVYRSVDTNDKSKLKENKQKLHENLMEVAKKLSRLKEASQTPSAEDSIFKPKQKWQEIVIKVAEESRMKAANEVSKLIFSDLQVEEQDYWGSDVRFMGNLKRGSVPPTDTPDWSYGNDVVKLRDYIHRRVTSIQGWRATSLQVLAQHLSLVWDCICSADFELNFSSRVEYNSYMELHAELQAPTDTVARTYEEVFKDLQKKIWSIKEEDAIGPNGTPWVGSLESRVSNVVEEQSQMVRKMLEIPRWQKWKVSTMEEWERSCRNTGEWYKRGVEDAVNGVIHYEKVVTEYELQCKIDIAGKIDRGEWRLRDKDDRELEEEFEKFFSAILVDAEKKYPRMADEVPRRVMQRYSASVHDPIKKFDFYVNVETERGESTESDFPRGFSSSSGGGVQSKSSQSRKVLAKLKEIIEYDVRDAKQFSDVIVDGVIKKTTQEIEKSGLSKAAQREAHLWVRDTLSSKLTKIQSRWDADHNIAEKLRGRAKQNLSRFFINKAKGLEATASLMGDLQNILEAELQEAHIRRVVTKVADLVATKQWAKKWMEMRKILDLHLLTLMEKDDQEENIDMLIMCVRDESTHFQCISDALIRQLMDANRIKEEWEWLLQKVQDCLREGRATTAKEGGETMSHFITKLLHLLKVVEIELGNKVEKRTFNYLAIHGGGGGNNNSNNIMADIILDAKFNEEQIPRLCGDLAKKEMPSMDKLEDKLLHEVKDRLKGRAVELYSPKCREACPRCGSCCTRSLDHSDLHDCIHQPGGLKGDVYHRTNELWEKTCLQSSDDGERMRVHGHWRKVRFSNFEKVYPKWTKPASTDSTSMQVRESVFLRYQKQLADHYSAKPCPQSKTYATYDHDVQRLRNEMVTRIQNTGDFDNIHKLKRTLGAVRSSYCTSPVHTK